MDEGGDGGHGVFGVGGVGDVEGFGGDEVVDAGWGGAVEGRVALGKIVAARE